MANDIAKSGVLLDENGNQLIVNTRAELVWVKATDVPHYVPCPTGEVERDIRLSEVLKNVVYDSHNQTIDGIKTFKKNILLTLDKGTEDTNNGIVGKFGLSNIYLLNGVHTTSGEKNIFVGGTSIDNTNLLAKTKAKIGLSGDNDNNAILLSDNSLSMKLGSTGSTEVYKATNATTTLAGSTSIQHKIGSNIVTVTNQYGIYSNGGVAAMGIIETSTGGGSVGKLADCSDVDFVTSGNENFVKRTEPIVIDNREVWIAQQGDVLYAYGQGMFKAKPVFDNNGKLLIGLLPDAALGNVMYGGTFKEGGVCTLTDTFKSKYGETSYTIDNSTAGTHEGVFFISQIEGTVVGQQVNKGDWLISSGSSWDKVDNNDAVTGVKGEAESTYRLGDVNITKGNIGLGNVENTKLSTWTGSGYITTLGTITSGTWQGSAIADTYISSATAWNAKYDKPSTGIPKTDLASGVQTSLGKADSALQSHQTIYSLTITHNGTSKGTYTPNSKAETIEITTPTALSGLADDATHRLVTDTQISAWNAKWDYNADTIKGVKVNNATNADNDGSGNNIVNTYATKTSLSDVSTALSGGIADNSERIASLENWVASPVADKMEVSTLNVTGEVNLNGQVFSSLDGIFDLVSSGVILARHIADANIGTEKIVDGAITTAKIGNGAVTNAKIADGTIANAKLANSSLTIGSTSISLGGSSTTLAGLTSVTSTKFVGSLEGTADKAKADEDGNNIKSTYFKKSGGTISGDIVVTGTISGSLANSSNFGHINVDGVWVSDYTYNNSSTIYVPIVKTGHIITDSDSVHKQASVVVDSDGKGYVVSQLGYNVGSETYDSVPV